MFSAVPQLCTCCPYVRSRFGPRIKGGVGHELICMDHNVVSNEEQITDSSLQSPDTDGSSQVSPLLSRLSPALSISCYFIISTYYERELKKRSIRTDISIDSLSLSPTLLCPSLIPLSVSHAIRLELRWRETKRDRNQNHINDSLSLSLSLSLSPSPSPSPYPTLRSKLI